MTKIKEVKIMENNKMIELQEIVFKQLKRLDDEELMKEKCAEEIARSNVVSNNAQTFIKAVNMQLRILEFSKKNEMSIKDLHKKIGV
jgi:hypothetical protein